MYLRHRSIPDEAMVRQDMDLPLLKVPYIEAYLCRRKDRRDCGLDVTAIVSNYHVGVSDVQLCKAIFETLHGLLDFGIRCRLTQPLCARFGVNRLAAVNVIVTNPGYDQVPLIDNRLKAP